MKRSWLVLGVVLTCLPLVASAQRNRQAPPFLLDEVFRLTRQCYFFQEYATFEQKNKWYILAVFLSREAVRPASGTKAAVSPQSPCDPKLPQVRLYRFVNDTTVVFCDSVFINSYRASVGGASAFDNSGLQKIMINQACNPSEGALAPLLCYTLSVFEITEKSEFRNLLSIGNVPERWMNDQPTGRPLEPVVSDNLDKTIYPELLAVDDFFEGDPAFRVDDFPKITLVYSWDPKAKAFKHKSDQFPGKFAASAEIARMPDDAKLVTIMERVMVLAAVKRMDDAKKLMNLNITPERISRWKTETPERSVALALDRLKHKLTRCIERYEQ
jgi:hypothetical protein